MLQQGEEVLWFGKPAGPPPYTALDLMNMVIGGAFACIGLVLVYMGAGGADAAQSQRVPLVVFALVFAGLAVFGGFGRFLWARNVWRKTIYALTSERVIKVIETNTPRRYAYSRIGVTSIDAKTNDNGSGSIFFSIPQVYDWAGHQPGSRGNNPLMDPNGVAFCDIPDVHHVLALMQRPEA